MRFFDIDMRGRTVLNTLLDDPVSNNKARIYYNLAEETVKFQDGTSSLTFFHEGNIEQLIESMNNSGLSLWEKVDDTYLIGDATSTVEIVTNLKLDKMVYYDEIYDNGNSGTSKQIDWNNGNRQKILMTGNCTFTFSDPPGPCNLMLSLQQDATGNRTATWPASVKWVGALTPTLSTGVNDYDIVGLFFDGTNYYSTISKDFA